MSASTPTTPVDGAKNPSRVSRGRLGAAARWGPEPRRVIVRLDELPAPARRLILALAAAAKAEAERDPESAPAPSPSSP